MNIYTQRVNNNMVKDKSDEKEPEWSECSTLEEWVERMLREGYTQIVVNMMSSMSEEKKQKYRAIWVRVMEEKKK